MALDRADLPVAEIGSSDDLQVGDAVVAIGNALGLEGEPTVTTGCAARERIVSLSRVFSSRRRSCPSPTAAATSVRLAL